MMAAFYSVEIIQQNMQRCYSLFGNITKKTEIKR